MGTKVEFREVPALCISSFVCPEGPQWDELGRIGPEDCLNLPAKLSLSTLNPAELTKSTSNDTITRI